MFLTVITNIFPDSGWLFVANCIVVNAFWLIFWELNYRARSTVCYYYPVRNAQMEFPKIASDSSLWPGAQPHWLLFLDNWDLTSSLPSSLFNLQKRPVLIKTFDKVFLQVC